MMTPLNWKHMVEETLRRRKQEGLTQREHAALANVSIPTMAAFERAETTLTLAKAFDVLRVVGLVDEPGPEDEHDRFVQEAMARWRRLTDALPEDSPGRMPHGWFRFDYRIIGELRKTDLKELESFLDQAEINHTGWPLFLIPRYWKSKPLRHHKGRLECWLYLQEGIESSPSESEFWTATSNGSFFLIRGYQEDGQVTFPPARLFDTSLPIWRIGEVLLHAERMVRAMSASSNNDQAVLVRAEYTGLLGRVLKSWANPISTTGYEGQTASKDETIFEVELKADEIVSDLAGCVTRLVSALYNRFGVSEVQRGFVENELNRMRSNTVKLHL